MKTFKQFISENELIKTATKDVEGVQNYFNSGKFKKKKEKYTNLVKGGLEGIVQGLRKDANISVTKFLKKVENFKLPTK